eukprot:761922-Alexandrium_andersonii.AAC.1
MCIRDRPRSWISHFLWSSVMTATVNGALLACWPGIRAARLHEMPAGLRQRAPVLERASFRQPGRGSI